MTLQQEIEEAQTVVRRGLKSGRTLLVYCDVQYVAPEGKSASLKRRDRDAAHRHAASLATRWLSSAGEVPKHLEWARDAAGDALATATGDDRQLWWTIFSNICRQLAREEPEA